MSLNDYSAMTRDDLLREVGGTEEEIHEAVASLIEKGFLSEHHDGGFMYNDEMTQELLRLHDMGDE